jgi:hypothetical protein
MMEPLANLTLIVKTMVISVAVAVNFTKRVAEVKVAKVPAESLACKGVLLNRVLDESKAYSSSSRVDTVREPDRAFAESLFLKLLTLNDLKASFAQLFLAQSRFTSIEAMYVPTVPSAETAVQSAAMFSLKHSRIFVSIMDG